MINSINNTESRKLKELEYHLKNYNIYKSAIKNLQKQLSYLIPNFTADDTTSDCSNSEFKIEMVKDTVDLDRISSLRALNLYEELLYYKLIISSIDTSLEELDELEHEFVILRYKKGYSIIKTSLELGYSEKYVFNIRKHALRKLMISLKGILFLN
ncbi:sigma-70 family RNA polymerase sigma factor [Virgibacillus salexigens]|uniref:Sigma-70 family RNA polymerase sigma factor n=1 Tax=Virgibacillus kapii TaxID=1638645 RepID=A0ABQ2DXP7_9BACI|nr:MULTISPECIES: sigma-70 family RNA polymerase sigma factor [Virgibacillus]MYL43933.1 sigma-70 family RNA polymerase sigma factor [Virgibacillus massiliensis]GGJ77002.1 hypothetical protein GCM10007111_43340 [Virgibacillus kapii]